MDMVIVEVLEAGVIDKSGEFTNDAGESIKYDKKVQSARLHSMGYVYPFEVRLEKGGKPFAPGRYVLNLAKMVDVNKGNLNFSKYPVLEPLPAQTKAA